MGVRKCQITHYLIYEACMHIDQAPKQRGTKACPKTERHKSLTATSSSLTGCSPTAPAAVVSVLANTRNSLPPMFSTPIKRHACTRHPHPHRKMFNTHWMQPHCCRCLCECAGEHQELAAALALSLHALHHRVFDLHHIGGPKLLGLVLMGARRGHWSLGGGCIIISQRDVHWCVAVVCMCVCYTARGEGGHA